MSKLESIINQINQINRIDRQIDLLRDAFRIYRCIRTNIDVPVKLSNFNPNDDLVYLLSVRERLVNKKKKIVLSYFKYFR